MTDIPAFQPVTPDGRRPEAKRVETMSSLSHLDRIESTKLRWWAFAGLWLITATLLASTMYGLGHAAKIHGRWFFDGIGGSMVWGSAFGAPFAVLGALGLKRRQGGFRQRHWAQYGILFLASLPAATYSWTVFSLGGFALTFGHLDVLIAMPLTGSRALLITVLTGTGILFGSYLLRGQLGRGTLAILGLWLLAGASLQVPLADPDFHLFMDLAWGSGGVMLLTFAAARPLYCRDRITQGWPQRWRYYSGALLVTIGTLCLFVLGEGVMQWLFA